MVYLLFMRLILTWYNYGENRLSFVKIDGSLLEKRVKEIDSDKWISYLNYIGQYFYTQVQLLGNKLKQMITST
jgi:hypothetical protein